MVEVTTGRSPRPAALVSRFDTASAFEVARALAARGFRLALLHPDAKAGDEQRRGLPPAGDGPHEVIVADPDDPASLRDAVAEAERRLDALTALVHVIPVDADADASARLDPAVLSREIARGAGALLTLGLAALPGMLATQTGALCAVLEVDAEGASPGGEAVGATTAVGAVVGAVSELARLCEGTPLRALLLCPPLAGAASPTLGDDQAGELARQISGEGDLPSGHFARLSDPDSRGEIRLLARLPAAPSPAVVAAPSPAVVAVSADAADAALVPDEVSETLAVTFRAALGLSSDVDVSACAVGSVPRWDSLGHLKLMMEVEQALRVRLPADALSRIQSYRDLETAVRAALPAR